MWVLILISCISTLTVLRVIFYFRRSIIPSIYSMNNYEEIT